MLAVEPRERGRFRVLPRARGSVRMVRQSVARSIGDKNNDDNVNNVDTNKAQGGKSRRIKK